MRATPTSASRPSPSSTTAAAIPRRHPRPTSQFAAGSSANERNRAATSHNRRCCSRRTRLNAAYATKAVMTIVSSSRGIHAGMPLESPGECRPPRPPRVWASASVRFRVAGGPLSGSGGSCAAAGSIRAAYRPSFAGASIGVCRGRRYDETHARRRRGQDRAADRDAQQAATAARPARPAPAVGRREHARARGLRLAAVEENHRLGREHLNAGRYFPAHEAWETAWKQSRDTDDAEFFKGLSQLGAGYVHLLRGNAHGAMRLLRRASGRIRAYPVGPLGGRDRAGRGRRRGARGRRRARARFVPGEDAVFVPPRV